MSATTLAIETWYHKLRNRIKKRGSEMASRRGKQNRKRYRKLERKLASKGPTSRAGSRRPQLIGYTARRGMIMVCNNQQACVVIGSRGSLITFLEERSLSPQDHVIEPASSQHVISGMSLGGKYALDRHAFKKFLPLARTAGLNLEAVDFAEDPSDAVVLAELSLPNIQCDNWLGDLHL
jgi:hypothetical protein